MKNHLALVALSLLVLTPCWADPLKSSYGYQGSLRQAGSPADGEFDFSFEIYDQVTAGNLLAGPSIHENILVSNGLFSTEIDFGNDILAGDALWIEVGVREGSLTGPGMFTILAPRQPFNLFALNGKEAALSSPLTGVVTKTTANPTILGSGTAFNQELKVGDAVLIAEEIFTVTSIINDTQMLVNPPPMVSDVDVPAFSDGVLFKVQAGDKKDQFVVGRDGIRIGQDGVPITRIDHGTIGECTDASTGTTGSVTFSEPFLETPLVLLTPDIQNNVDQACDTVRLLGRSTSGFSWDALNQVGAQSCSCIHWLAIGVR